MKQFQKLVFKPGINREGTNYAAEGFWWDCDRIRFRMGLPETIGGWAKTLNSQFLGICRALRSWVAIDDTPLLGLGTSKKLYLMTGEALYDVTPVVYTSTKTNPLTTGAAGSSVITVETSAAHGANIGDYVTVSGATGFDGVLAGALNAEFVILSIPSTVTFTVDTGDTCTAGTITGGGASVTVAVQLGIGADSASIGSGWGIGPYSRSTYSSPWSVPYSSYNSMRVWTLSNYGEDLVAACFGKGLYYWDATNGVTVRAVPFTSLGGATGVPPEVGYALVTNERHVVALGATDLVSGKYDPMLIRWASQEAPADWTPTVSNTSGDYRLAVGSHIEAYASTRDEILVLTDKAVYSMRYSGAPYVFDIRQVADNISAAGPNAIITLNSVTYWMGHKKFYMYTGAFQSIPCTVHRHVFEDFNHNQARQVCCGHVEQFSEVWWFYPSADSEFNDKYVVYNYTDQLWFIGNMNRTAWAQDATSHLMQATSNDGYLYTQEFGIDDGSANPPVPLNSFIESSDFDIQDGTSHYFVERIIPDVRFDRSVASGVVPEVHFTLKARDFPGQNYQAAATLDDENAVYQTATAPVGQYTKELWVRVRGRQIALRVESDADDVGTAWQLGYPRISVRTDGRR